MRAPQSIRFLVATVVAGLLLAAGAPLDAQRRAIPRVDGRAAAQSSGAYDFGYREGLQRGDRDGRDNRQFNFERDGTYRSADRGYNRTFGNRDAYRTEFRRGFAAGYRTGYDRYRSNLRNGRNPRFERNVPRGYREPASARGYSDGYEKGLDDGRDRDRYDPVRHGDYRSADDGYYREYGSKDAYKNNYRAGFRQGYEDGYRAGARR